MKYKIKRIPIELKFNQIIEFEAEELCKIIQVDYWHGTEASVIVLERWGEKHSRPKTHKIVILREGEEFEMTLPYEPTLSRRESVNINGEEYFVFQIGK